MLFEALRPWQLYNGQTSIPLPKRESKYLANDTEETTQGTYKVGKGNVVFLLAPNLKASEKILIDPSVKFVQSTYHYYSIDGRYVGHIGKKQLVKNETALIKKRFDTIKMPLSFIPQANRKTYVKQMKNFVIDLSRWMELYFTYSYKNSPKAICKNFINFLATHINTDEFEGYHKTIFLDLNSWIKSSDQCIVMNKSLLTNPLAIFLYTAYHYPDMLKPLFGMTLYLVNRDSNQLFIMKTDDLNKDLYPKLKAKIAKFKDLQFSAFDETDDSAELTENEVKAEITQEFKEKLVKSMKANLLGASASTDVPEDITSEFEDEPTISEDIPDLNIGEIEDDFYTPEEEEPSSISDTTDLEELIDPDETIRDEVERYVDEHPDAPEEEDPRGVAAKLTPEVKKKVYISTFMPKRSEQEIAKIERLTADQQKVIAPPDFSDVESKIIEIENLGKFVDTANPDILQGSKYQNFDRSYVKKKLPSDIDNAVAALSKAEHPIFVIDKEVTDSSTPLDLKKTYTYRMEDEKGNKFTLKFDVPIVFDGNYVYLNGSKKIISHQYLLKPIAKTGTDTVQLVSFYLKIFIYRLGIVDENTNFFESYLGKHPEEFKIRPGNAALKNKDYETPLDFDMIAKRYYSYELNGILYIQELDALLEKGKKLNPQIKMPDLKKEIPIGYNRKTKEFVTLAHGESYTEKVLSTMTELQIKELSKIKKKPRLISAKMKLQRKMVPVMLFMLYCEGFRSCMEKANIKYEFIDKKEKRNKNPLQWGFIELEDCLICWDKSSMANCLLMNGIMSEPFNLFTREELESKDTYTNLISRYYDTASAILKLDQTKEFFIDDVTKEVLIDYGYPTDLVSLMVVAVRMLCDSKYKAENYMGNCRIRSPEVIANLVYLNVTNAYYNYRRTSYKKKPQLPSIKQSAVIDDLLSADVRLIEENSMLNPVWSLEKSHSVTFKGIRGIQMDRAMTLPRRGYDDSMLGICGISTSPDANVGVVRNMSLEPNITSTRGYLDVKGKEGVDELRSIELFSPGELLTPLGVLHDDPDRTSMNFKQTKQMLPVADASPVLIGNKVESIVPYYLPDDFVVDAKQDGKVIDKTEDFLIVQYADGSNQAIDISNNVKKNSSAGFFLESKLDTSLNIGDKFKKGEILAHNDKAFTMNANGKSASMNLGVLTKIAITSNWDVYEDSTPVTKKLSERMATNMIAEKTVVLEPATYVDYIVKVGDHVNTDDPLLKFSRSDDIEITSFLRNVRDEHKEEVLEDTRTTIRSKYTGTVVDIKMFSTVDLEDMDESLRKIVSSYYKRINRRNAVLDKYANPDDAKYFKAGQIIEEVGEVMEPSKTGKIRGDYVDHSVKIVFYIMYHDSVAKGDKVTAEFPLKGVCSHVIEEGYEPFSEYRPDEEISTLIAPLAIAARKTDAIFFTMFTNKLLIELKRQLKDKYFGTDTK